MKVVPYSENQKMVWDAFVDVSKNGIFMFKRGFMDYHADRFSDASLLIYNDSEELIALMPATRHGEEIRSHGGLTYGGILSSERMKQAMMLECFEAIRVYYLAQGIKRIIYKSIPHIFHRLPSEEDTYALFRCQAKLLKVEPASVADLQRPYKLPKGRKAQISRAKREGITIRETTDFAAFIALENEVLSKHHNATAVHTGEELTLLHNRFPEQIKSYCAYDKENQICGGCVVFIYDYTVHTQYLAANDYARENGGLDLVISEVMSLYRQTHRYFDFGISTEEMGAFLNVGLIAQKEGFGGRSVAYLTWEIPL